MLDFVHTLLRPDILFGLLVAASATLAVVLGRWLHLSRGFDRDPVPISHKIAVIGLPGAGKTTLITALFELIQRGVHVPNARLHGVKTIQAVNRNVARLSGGELLAPTKEKDIFVFRFSYRKQMSLFSYTYDVEIADFPGEFSERMVSSVEQTMTDEISALRDKPDASYPDQQSHRLAPQRYVSNKDYAALLENALKQDSRGQSRKPRLREDGHLAPRPKAADDETLDKFEYTLFKEEFFSWIASSREYLFLIDLSSIYSSKNVRSAIADLTARIRTSWQVIEDAASERGIGSARRRTVHVIFTKADSVLPIFSLNSSLTELLNAHQNTEPDKTATFESLKEAVKEKGSATDLSALQPIAEQLYSAMVEENDQNFSHLLEFFHARVKATDVIYTSMVLRDLNGNRVGIRKILEAVLP